ncbi:MAG: pentapeptide repeat-containing protein, partial [Ktedonobacteraceae bacterium]
MMDELARRAMHAELSPDIEDHEAWSAFWTRQGQAWRTEPEIDAERQAELAAHRAIPPDVVQGIYPFRRMKLNRADIEWLLATHEDGRGPVDYHDPSQRGRVGLDLRGADLSYAQLQNLPLARTIGDVTWRTWANLTEKQHRMAAMHMQHVDLKGAYLEGSSLEYADLEGADLRGCHLEEANLGATSLKGAYCEFAHMEGADFWLAHLEGAFLWRTYLQGTRLSEA